MDPRFTLLREWLAPQLGPCTDDGEDEHWWLSERYVLHRPSRKMVEGWHIHAQEDPLVLTNRLDRHHPTRCADHTLWRHRLGGAAWRRDQHPSL